MNSVLSDKTLEFDENVVIFHVIYKHKFFDSEDFFRIKTAIFIF